MTNERMKHILVHITSIAYPASPVPDFSIELLADENNPDNGIYDAGLQRIRIFHLLRGGADVLATAIHEMSHHLRTCRAGAEAGQEHDLEFYTTMWQLFCAAIGLGYLTEDEVRDIHDTDSYRLMTRQVGRLAPYYLPAGQLNDRYRIIYVRNPKDRAINPRLSEWGFKYSPLEQQWEADNMVEGEAERVMAEIRGLSPRSHVFEKPVTEIYIDPVYRVIVESGRESYMLREELARRKYRYNGQRRSWQKDTRREGLSETSAELNRLGLAFTVSSVMSALSQ